MTKDARSSAPSRARAALAVAGLVACLCGYLITQFGDAIRVPFINDDYIFLDLTRSASFLSLFHPHDWWVGGWYRPWSRELHYWALQRLFGTAVEPWHVVSFALWLSAIGLYYTLARRLTGGRRATVAVAGVAALSAWSVPLVWVAGVQELWMLVWALATLQLWARGQVRWATATFVLALLSKETAALVPGIALAEAVVLERERVTVALRRLAPLLAVLAVWALLHPLLGGRVWAPHAEPVLPGVHASLASIAMRSLLALVNLDAWPHPEGGWPRALLTALPAALLLAAFCAWALRGGPPAASEPAAADAGARDAPTSSPWRLTAFGLGWAMLAWLPFALPSVGWHAYYGLLGALGAWLAIAAWLEKAPVPAPAVVTALALIAGARAVTPSDDWGTEWFQRRAASFTDYSHHALMALVPSLPKHSRVFLTGQPSGANLVAGGEESPVLRAWYRDRTLRVMFYSRYRPRAAGDSLGRDVFLRYDPRVGWSEVAAGSEDVVSSRRANPLWREDHERLAATLAEAQDWPGTVAELEKLATAFPGDSVYAWRAGLARAAVGDSLGARRWLERANRSGRRERS